MEPIELRIRLDTDKGTLKASRALTLGNTYAVTFDGKEGECSLYLLRCRDGKTVAASTADFILAVNTQEALDLFPKDTKCPSETFVHAYVTYDGNVIAAGDVIIRYSPIAFTAAGLPVTMQGEQGERGERGKSVFEEWLEHNPDGTWGQFMQSIKGARGADGRDAVVIKTSGLYAFSVPDENLLMHVPDLRTFYYTDPVTGDVDTTRPKWAISESGHLLHNVYTDEGKTVVLDLGKVRGETGTGAFEAWQERNPEGSFDEFLETIKGEKGDQGEPGAPGLSADGVREIVEGYGYAKATDLVAYVKTADADTKYALADALAKVAKNLEDKQDALVFDDKTVPESKNPVTSGGLHSQFQQVEARIADLVARIDGCYARVTAVMAFRGAVDTADELPDSGENLTGDVWTVRKDGAEYVWNGFDWEYLGRVIDLSAYATKEELVNFYASKVELYNVIDTLRETFETELQNVSSYAQQEISAMAETLRSEYSQIGYTALEAIEKAEAAASAAATAKSGVDSLTAIVNELVGETDTFEDHIANKDNPHEVTAEQVGAVPSTGGTVNGDLFVSGNLMAGEITNATGVLNMPTIRTNKIQLLDATNEPIDVTSPITFEEEAKFAGATFSGATAFNGGIFVSTGTNPSADKAIRALGDIVVNNFPEPETYSFLKDVVPHLTNTDNPHEVTAAQVGALPLSGGSLSGSLSIRGGLTTGSESDVYIGEGMYVGKDVRIGYLSTDGQGVSLLSHVQSAANPHGVTAEQAGALPAFVNENASLYEGAKYVNVDTTFLHYIKSYQCAVRQILSTNRLMFVPTYHTEDGASSNNAFPVINGGENLQHFDIGRGVDSPNTTYVDVSYDFIFRRGVQALAGIEVTGDATFNGKVSALSITNGGDITDVFASLRHHQETLEDLIQSYIPNLQDAVASLQSTIASLQERIAELEAANNA